MKLIDMVIDHTTFEIEKCKYSRQNLVSYAFKRWRFPIKKLNRIKKIFNFIHLFPLFDQYNLPVARRVHDPCVVGSQTKMTMIFHTGNKKRSLPRATIHYPELEVLSMSIWTFKV